MDLQFKRAVVEAFSVLTGPGRVDLILRFGNDLVQLVMTPGQAKSLAEGGTIRFDDDEGEPPHHWLMHQWEGPWSYISSQVGAARCSYRIATQDVIDICRELELASRQAQSKKDQLPKKED